MAVPFRTFYLSCRYVRNITKPVKWSTQNYSVRVTASGISYTSNELHKYLDYNQNGLTARAQRSYSNACSPCPNPNEQKNPKDEPPKKLGLVQRLKAMYKSYWYVVVPVHVMTSAIWFGSLYYVVRSGVDVVALLESIGISDKLLAPLKDSSAGYVALTFALYKVITPLRYAVTIGGTTVAIKRLTALGWIKPVPSKERLKEMIQERKDNMQESIHKHYQVQKDRKNHLLDEMRRYKKDIKMRMKKM